MSEGSFMELAKKRLVDLSPKILNPEEKIEVLDVSENRERLSREIIDRSWSCDIHQLLLPLFRPLLQEEPEVRGRVARELLPLGLPVRVVFDYFLNMGDQPYLVFALRQEEVSNNVKENLRDMAEEIMLRELRGHLFRKGPGP